MVFIATWTYDKNNRGRGGHVGHEGGAVSVMRLVVVVFSWKKPVSFIPFEVGDAARLPELGA